MSMSDDNARHLTYEATGVSIDRGQAAVEAIKTLAKTTRRPEVIEDVGGFSGVFRLGDFELVSGADGVGSKLLIAQTVGVLNTIGIDLVAMNVNDVLASGGEPLFFLDYIAIGRLLPDRVRDLAQGMVVGCREAGCALLGGETAEMPDLYGEKDFDLAGFAVGRRIYRTQRAAQPGDRIIGLASSGFHSNGYQLIRTVVREQGLSYGAKIPKLSGRSLGEVLLTPTRIYVKAVQESWPVLSVGAMAHITGGGLLENLPRTLGGLGARLTRRNWRVLPEMELIREWGSIADAEMARTFNLGIGFTLTVPPEEASQAVNFFESRGVAAYEIGQVLSEPGVELV